MIVFNYETSFVLKDEKQLVSWVKNVSKNKGFEIGEVNFIFCDDAYLHKLNVEFLNHDTLTDIISFDNSIGKILSGDIFISVERVKENAIDFDATFDDELHRVMIHGILHFMGLRDKSKMEKVMMREAENEALFLLKI